MAIQRVDEYNSEARGKYRVAVDKWERTGGFPALSMYIFSNRFGNPIKKGYVVSKGHSHHYVKTLKEAKRLEKVI